MEIPVGELTVIAYISVNCPKHAEGWALKGIPVADCFYYQCALTGDAKFYDKYMDVVAKRHSDARAKYPYEKFVKLVEELKTDGGYKSDKAEKDPMRVYRGTKYLHDGHHRAAILCALYGPETEVSVDEVTEGVPSDVDDCGEPCDP